jgi:hypothetical protein
VLLPSRIQHGDGFGHEQRRQWNILCYHQVPGLCVLGDILIGDVRSTLDPDSGDLGSSDGDLQALVGDEDRCDLQPLRGAEYEVLDLSRRGIRVDPDPQRTACIPRTCSAWNNLPPAAATS